LDPIQTLIVSLCKDEELLQYGLIVLWEILEYLTLPMEGHEAEVFTILLTVRYSNKPQVRQYANDPSKYIDEVNVRFLKPQTLSATPSRHASRPFSA